MASIGFNPYGMQIGALYNSPVQMDDAGRLLGDMVGGTLGGKESRRFSTLVTYDSGSDTMQSTHETLQDMQQSFSEIPFEGMYARDANVDRLRRMTFGLPGGVAPAAG